MMLLANQQPLSRRGAVQLTAFIAIAWASVCPLASGVPPVFDDVSGLDQLRIVNEFISDNPASPEVPSPLTRNVALAAYDFSPFTIAVQTSGHARSAASGAMLISPSFAIVAGHAPGIQPGNYVWMTTAGVEVSRSRIAGFPIIGANGVSHPDLSLIQLSSPITTIEPIAILTDCSALSGEKVAVLEQDYHVNVMNVGRAVGLTTIDNTATSAILWRPSADGDALESGDSGKFALAFIEGRPVLVSGGLYTAGTSGANAYGDAPNVSKFLAEISSPAQAAGETLTLIDSSSDVVSRSITAGGSRILVGGQPLVVEE